MFIALQHAVSSEIISRITGENLTEFDVNIQRYPHPPYVQDIAVEFLQFLLPLFLTLTFSYTAVNIVRAVTLEKELQLKVSVAGTLNIIILRTAKSDLLVTLKAVFKSGTHGKSGHIFCCIFILCLSFPLLCILIFCFFCRKR